MKKITLRLLLLSLSTLPVTALGDDSDLYTSTTSVPPNVVFIIDTSGSMLWEGARDAYNNKISRLEVVQEAAEEAINKLGEENININVSLMGFNKNQGGHTVTKMTPINSPASREQLIDDIYDIEAFSSYYTPAIETYFNAKNFLLGEPLAFQSQASKNNRGTYTTDANGLHTYIKQVDDSLSCQKNNIILFTDGSSSLDNGVDARIHNLTLKQYPEGVGLPSGLSTTCKTPSNGNPQYNDPAQLKDSCGEELAHYLFKEKNIRTYTVGGFDTNPDVQNVLKNIAKFGGQGDEPNAAPQYFNASDKERLAEALIEVFRSIDTNSKTGFAAPAVAISAYSFIGNNSNQNVYFPLFSPKADTPWEGNLKRYKISKNGLLDQNDALAIDASSGVFKDTAQSYWSAAADGADVAAGGLASRLASPRNVYTYLGGNRDLTDASNSIAQTSASHYTTQTLTASQLNDIKLWVNGYKSDGSVRKEIGDSVHTQPLIFNYKNGNSTKAVLFMTTNDGYLHAVDLDDQSPSILYSFIPKELLSTAYKYYKKDINGNKTYGLDGQLSFYHQDVNKDNVIDSNDKLYLYMGMRRGGNSYYALDVSDLTKPEFKWQINGARHPSTTSGFEKLGQTWSKMTPITLSNQTDPVLVFGGGYDVSEDSNSVRTNHTVGNAIYFVSALNGQLLSTVDSSTTGAENMNSSIVSNIIPVDKDSDADIDILYAADLGGRIWRIDANNTLQVTLLADFNDGTRAGNRRFFASPDVSYSTAGYIAYKESQGATEVSKRKMGRFQISIGSGYRAKPLNTEVNDKFFLINDLDVTSTPGVPAPDPLGVTDLADYKTSSSTDVKRKRGFYLDLSGTGEKVLASSLSTSGKIFFSTFTPSQRNDSLSCEAGVAGSSKRYTLKPDLFYEATQTTDETKVVDGNPVVPPKPNPEVKEDSCKGNCATTPPILTGGPNCKTVINAQEVVETMCTDPILKTFWRERE